MFLFRVTPDFDGHKVDVDERYTGKHSGRQTFFALTQFFFTFVIPAPSRLPRDWRLALERQGLPALGSKRLPGQNG